MCAKYLTVPDFCIPRSKRRDRAKCVRRTEERPQPREDGAQRIAAVVRCGYFNKEHILF